MAEKPHLVFVYPQAEGPPLIRRLTNWDETPVSVTGYCLTRMAERTYSKAKILAWLEESEREVVSTEPPLPPPPAPQAPKAVELLLTGFDKDTKAELATLAEAAGFVLRTKVTAGLDYLCAGPNAGPAKVAAATAQGVLVLDQLATVALIESGVLPS